MFKFNFFEVTKYLLFLVVPTRHDKGENGSLRAVTIGWSIYRCTSGISIFCSIIFLLLLQSWSSETLQFYFWTKNLNNIPSQSTTLGVVFHNH